ncbi:NAD(P)-binding protein [Backusella circina FSU 941]|nr:NAD(P)-binding protein [Backusella circina FSU 941]
MPTIFITGGTSGLGRAAARKLIALNYTVVITGRTEAKLDEAEKWIVKDNDNKGKLYKIVLEMGDFESIKKAVDTFDSFHISLDVLLHSAGCTQTSFQQVGDDNKKVERTVFENAICPLYLNRLLLPYIEKSNDPNRRIVIVTSMLHNPKIPGGSRTEETKIPNSVDLNDFIGSQDKWDSMKYYKISKLGNVWNSISLAETIPDIPVITFCPGFVPQTGLARNSGFITRMMLTYVVKHMSFTTSEEDSSDYYVYHATSPDMNTLNGKYFEKKKVAEPSTDALDDTKRKQYWEHANSIIDALII